jgi:hypothetical protein
MNDGYVSERLGGGVGDTSASSGIVCGWVGVSVRVGEANADAGDANEGE